MNRISRWLCAATIAAASAIACASALGPDGEAGRFHPGKFVWFDLATDDLPGARAFYGAVFGWDFRAVDGAPASYTLIEHEGGKVGGVFRQARPPGAPVGSRWIALMSVADPAKSAQYVQQNGGQVLLAPKTVAGRGTHAVFRDPQGAMFGVLAASGGDPSDDPVKDGDIFWLDLFAADPAKAATFYAGIAGYAISEVEAAPGHKRIVLASEDIARAGIVPVPGKFGPGWMPYILVEDLSAALDRVRAANGRVVVAPRDDLLAGRLAVIADPNGGVVGVIDWPERVAGNGAAK